MYCTEVLEKALIDGNKLHSFRSGSGLKVIRLEKDNKLTGYGEHPRLITAFKYTEEDYEAGHKNYEDVYGVTKPHYLTGTYDIDSRLDEWILQGHTIDAYYDENTNEFTVILTGFRHIKTPEEVYYKLHSTGCPVDWEHSEAKYKSTISPDGSITTQQVNETNGISFHEDFKRISKSKNLNNAFMASPYAPVLF